MILFQEGRPQKLTEKDNPILESEVNFDHLFTNILWKLYLISYFDQPFKQAKHTHIWFILSFDVNYPLQKLFDNVLQVFLLSAFADKLLQDDPEVVVWLINS